MKKKIGTLKSLKKYQDGGSSTFFNKLKNSKDIIKNSASSKVIDRKDMKIVPGTVPKVIGSDKMSNKPKSFVISNYNTSRYDMSRPTQGSIPKEKMGGSIKGKTPKTTAQKKFAALAPPKNKITFADKIAGSKKKK